MALPTTNLTGHWDASVNTNLWQEYQAGTPFHNTAAADATKIETWDDAGGIDLSFQTTNSASSTVTPLWRSGTPLMLLPCLDFDGSDDVLRLANIAGTVNKALSVIFANNAKTLAISIYIEAVSANNANPYANHCVFADNSAFNGLFFRSSGGAPVLQWYNWDGNADKVESSTLALDTSYVVIARHDGTTLNLRVNGTDATGVASGNTTTMTGQVSLGQITGAQYASVRIGEIAVYNANLTGTDLSDLDSYFQGRWLSAAGGTRGVPLGNKSIVFNGGRALLGNLRRLALTPGWRLAA